MGLIGNRVTEKDVRDHLTRSGYRGDTAKLFHLELVAIERPGWAQVFSFHAEARLVEGGRRELYGVVWDDERKGTRIRFTRDVQQQRQWLHEASQGRITRNRQRPTMFHWSLIGLAVLGLAAAAWGALRGV